MLTLLLVAVVLLPDPGVALGGLRLFGDFNAINSIKPRAGATVLEPASGLFVPAIETSRAKDVVIGSLHERQNTKGKCGAGYGSCAPGYCCSIGGACGKGFHYCSGPACQLSYGDACDGNLSPAGFTTKDVARPQNSNVSYGGKGIYTCTRPNSVALTFDDGPYIYTSALLDILAGYNAKATFFITGNNMGKGAIDNVSTGYPQIIQRMYQEGHQIAHHTWTHENLSALSEVQRGNQMYFNEMAFRNVLGFFPTYVRPPYSACNEGCQSLMAKLGYHIIYDNLNTKDYLNNNATLIQKSKDLVDGQFGTVNSAYPAKFIEIGHDLHSQTVYNLTAYILDRMAELGFGTSVTVGECLGDPKENWYRSADGAPSGAPVYGNLAPSLSSITPTAVPPSGPSTATSSTSSAASAPTVKPKLSFGWEVVSGLVIIVALVLYLQ